MTHRLLVIAGRDPSGGAGVDADRDALGSLDLEVTYVVTAETDQDDGEVRSAGARSPDLWLAEARGALPASAIKLGLLPGVEAVRAAADLLASAGGAPVVLDPVIESTSGFTFLDAPALDELRASLVPAGVILTPNLPELARLTDASLAHLAADLDARADAASHLVERGAAAVVVKGGHGLEDPAVDLLVRPGGRPLRVEHERIRGARLRGTGCRFASALAGHLALGGTLEQGIGVAGSLVLDRLGGGAETRS